MSDSKKQSPRRGDEEVNKAIGSLIRFRRNQLKLSQELVAGKLGVTFQQLQKYEKGTNRVPSDRLLSIAKVLDVPISYFFNEQTHNETSVMKTPETLELILKFNALPEKRRQQVLRLTQMIVEHDDATIITLHATKTDIGVENGHNR